MRKHRLILALGLIVFGTVAFLPALGAQTVVGVARPTQIATIKPAGCPCWPPKPQNMVNVDSDQTSAIVVVDDGTLSPGTLYTVPANKTLVVTNFEMRNRPSVGAGGIPLYPFAEQTPVQLVELATDGTVTVKRGASFNGNHTSTHPGPFTGIPANLVEANGAHGYRSSGVGMVFASGSELKFRIRDPGSVATPTSPTPVVVVEFTLTGYLVNN